jgi:hypothetical protein
VGLYCWLARRLKRAHGGGAGLEPLLGIAHVIIIIIIIIIIWYLYSAGPGTQL